MEVYKTTMCCLISQHSAWHSRSISHWSACLKEDRLCASFTFTLVHPPIRPYSSTGICAPWSAGPTQCREEQWERPPRSMHRSKWEDQPCLCCLGKIFPAKQVGLGEGLIAKVERWPPGWRVACLLHRLPKFQFIPGKWVPLQETGSGRLRNLLQQRTKRSFAL